MAELVATMVVGPLLSIVKEKASSYLLDQYKVMEGMEEQHEILMRKLPAILDVITDAEQAAAHRGGAKAWLEAIKKVAYQAIEVFDEFKYEALRRQAKEKGHYTNLGFHVIKLFPTHNRVAFRNKMGNKLRRIVQAIEVLVAEMNAFGFQYKQQAPPSKQWRQTDHVIFDPHKIINNSRGEDCKNIVDILLGQASNAALTVVPIVGIGGLGKTTLAQLVFNHPDVQKHFELLRWVCVSDSFDVDSLANTIVEALPKKKKDDTEAYAKKSALDCLKDALSGQRYLLVLDDVWNREGDKWEKLKASLQYGGKGSVILTTTRDEGVANVMGTVKAYYLTALKDEFIKEIIEARAFSLQKEEERPDVLVNMVGEITKRCAGSPLAATALGSVLRTKNSEEEWKKSISNICTKESGILPILKLSYNDLPSHMKQCFAFCAVFPKDYEIDVDKLIQLWIANGFIEEQEGVRLEIIGKQIFNELASRLFFQDVKQVQIVSRIMERRYCKHTCKIHDLMHDVAQSIMEKECVVAAGESSHVKWLTNTARHLFLSCRSPQLFLNTSLNETSPAIQTLVCDSAMSGSLQHLSKYSALRALRLRARWEGNTFPLKPKHLHHLRYLDLSGSSMEALPEDISILYNLQTLNLSSCDYLCRLPRQMKYMTALRHLYTHGCPNLKSMPPGLSKLVSLQTLTCFVVGTGSSCSNLRELQGLNLGGEIQLCQLENATEEDAKAANLAEKKELRELTLKWTVGCEKDVKVLNGLEPHDGQLQAIRIGCEKDVKVLNGLEPHDGQLQAIRINSYRGTTFPTWMEKLQCLFSRDTPFTFPNLKVLTLENLPNLERFAGVPPSLKELNIVSCHGLRSLESRSGELSLQSLQLRDCKILSSLPEGPQAYSSLRSLEIRNCPGIKTLPTCLQQRLGSLEYKRLDLSVPMAKLVVGPLLSIVKEKASSYLLDQYKVMEGMEEQHEMLKRKLLAILNVITDAEEAAVHRGGAKACLEAIKEVAYEANEVFDEFKYEALRRQAKEKGHYTNLGFHVVKLFLTHNRFAFRIKMGNKLRRIVRDIKGLVAEMNTFGFQHKQQAPPSKQWRQTDHVIFDPHKIISKSRGEDCKNIVDILLGQASNAALTVVPIVGIGGLGKTTLAQLVFNHPDVQKHFKLLLWVCVSDSFDVNSLANTIVQAHPKKKKDDTEADAKKKKDDTEADAKKSALDCLKDALSGQRYLLVLDDVWNREGDKWEKLKASLQYGGKGSAILTTTCDEGVANVMRTVEAYKLTSLKDEFIKEIIEARAFSLQKEEERPAVLVKMVGEIVKRCAGSPLAATALGSVLRTKNSVEEWEAVSSISNIYTEESGILPILKFSYNDLPSHIKQCFDFCAVFPKDYEIDVDKLIQLWIANGFIEEQEGVRLETIGKQIFNELASRSFFQDVKQLQVPLYDVYRKEGCYCRHTCKIHDRMHDVAQFIMEKECAVVVEESSYTTWLTNTARHLFLSCSSPQLFLNTSLNETYPAIQTLVCDSAMSGSLQHLTKYSSLRALRTRWEGNTFPLKPKHLHHLRYLDLSGSFIKALPEDISILYNLQTLNLSGCSHLHRLPRQIEHMTALRHLYTHGCPNLKSMPPGLSKLVSLQTLTCFVVGTGSSCSNLRELQDLNLRGEIELCQLENATEEDTKAANLAEKKELRKLTLIWTVGCEEDVKVLEGLEPHDEQLQAIRINSYGGATFPTWMVLLPKMTEIHLYGCEKLQYLFSRDTPFTFPNLKELTLSNLSALERFCEINNGEPGEEIIFPQLEKLFIIKCGKLTSLPGQPAFPILQNACIKKCPLLKTQLEAPNLGVLDMEGCEEEVFLY